MSHASHWRTARHQQKQCPSGFPEELWYDISARYKEYASRALELLRVEGPMTSRQIADKLAPELNSGRMGEVMKIIARDGHISKQDRTWVYLHS